MKTEDLKQNGKQEYNCDINSANVSVSGCTLKGEAAALIEETKTLCQKVLQRERIAIKERKRWQ